jgi:PAS domain S-box-containing protein
MSQDDTHLVLLEADFERVLDERTETLCKASDAERMRPGDGMTGRERTRETLREDGHERRFRQLLNALPAAVYTTDAAGRITFYNEAAVELWGCRPELGKSEWCGSWRLYWPDGRPMPHGQCPMAVALKEGRPIRGAEAVAERPDGTRIPFLPYPTPLRDASGELVGAVNMLVDITERKRAEEKQALLIRELHHRVKNTLATVQAIMGSTARASSSVEEFQEAFTGRIGSLAKTHSLLTEDHWQAVSFRALLGAELDPYDDGSGTRIRLDGPSVQLPSDLAVPIGMAVHELTTNAAKYGALSVLGGSVDVIWDLVTGNDARELRFEWIERDGPPVEMPSRQGFGSRLLERVLRTQIHADVRIDYAPDGVCIGVAVPLPPAAANLL